MVSEAEGADVLEQGGSHGVSVLGSGGVAVDVVGKEVDLSYHAICNDVISDIIPNMLYILYIYVYIIIPYHDNMPMYAYILCP